MCVMLKGLLCQQTTKYLTSHKEDDKELLTSDSLKSDWKRFNNSQTCGHCDVRIHRRSPDSIIIIINM